MSTLLLSVALAGSAVAPLSPAPLDCPTSAFWAQVDEAAFDLEVPARAESVTVTTGCTFVGPPGATVDLGDALEGLPVLGIRRGQGQVIVAASPAQAARLRDARGRLEAEAVRGGDWGPLLEEVERTRRAR